MERLTGVETGYLIQYASRTMKRHKEGSMTDWKEHQRTLAYRGRHRK